MAEVLHVKSRELRGKRNARRMRRAGTVPAVLYGHGEKTVSLSIAAEELAAALRHGSHLVELEGEVRDKALIRELQWDALGVEILHLDLARVSEHERVQVRVAIELRGSAPGVKEGGVVTHHLHEVEIECAAISIPDKLEVNINHLELGQSVLLSQVEAPAEVKLLGDLEAVVVECQEPAPEIEEDAVDTTGAEPEIIGRADDDEEKSDDE